MRSVSSNIGERVVEDIPVDWDAGEVALLSSGDSVRSLPSTTLTFRVTGRRAGADVEIGTYTLHHHALGYAPG